MAKDDEVDPVAARVLDFSGEQPIIPDRTLDPRTTGFLGESVRTTIDTIANNANAAGDTGKKMAKVCLVLTEEPDMWDWVGSFFDADIDGASGKSRLTVLAYVPRVHSMIPDPIKLAEKRGHWPARQGAAAIAKYNALVHSLLTDSSAKFTATTDLAGKVVPGAWVWVEYVDEVNKTNGVITSIAVNSNIPAPGSEAAESARAATAAGRELPRVDTRAAMRGDTVGAKARRREPVQLSSPSATLDMSADPPSAGVNWLIGSRVDAIGGYATKARGAHNGVDIYAKEGSKIFSATAGKVTRAGSIKGYGLTVLIHDADGDKLEFLYGHLSNMAVATGATVEKGQLIGYVGKTAHYAPFGKKAAGRDGQFFTDPKERAHLHFEVLENSSHVGYIGGKTKRVRQDPEAWLKEVEMELSEGLPVAKIPRSLTG